MGYFKSYCTCFSLEELYSLGILWNKVFNDAHIINLLQHIALKCYHSQIVKLFWVIVKCKYDFNSLNFEKLRSVDARVTWIVSITLNAIVAFGKQSCRFNSFRISTEPILISLGLKSQRNLNSTCSSLAAVS